MKLIDNRFLSLQIKNRLNKLNGMEFQSFFEDVMEKKDSKFRKIRPYGNDGDKGNDGYINSTGTFFQVHAPLTPKVNELNAARKLKEDFYKLENKWGNFKIIRKYIFVFNDKYLGSIEALEKSLEELRQQFPAIDFVLYLANDLETIIMKLKQEDLVALGFSIDQRQAISIVQKSLEDIRDEIDRENIFLVGKYIDNTDEIIQEVDEENITIEFELLQCKYLMLSEKPQEAIQKYESIALRYPRDPRSFLYLAEIFLNKKNLHKYSDLLERAKQIDADFWLICFLELVRQSRLGKKFNRDSIEEIDTPSEPWIKATFYRLFAQLLEQSGDEIGADEFIEKSLVINMNRFSSYIVRLSIWLDRLIKSKGKSEDISKKIIDEISSIKEVFSKDGEIRHRNKAILNSIEIEALVSQGDPINSMILIEETFDLILECSFDEQIEQILIQILQYVSIDNKTLVRLLDYLKQSDKEIIDFLAEILFGQFLLNNSLFLQGKDFFEEIGNKDMLGFIEIIENGEKEKLITQLEKKERFSFILAETLKFFPDLRFEIINSILSEKEILTKRLLLSFYIDEGNYDDAFSIIQEIDLSSLNSLECLPILEVLHKKEAWDIEVLLLQKLINQEKNKTYEFKFSLRLFIAYLNLKMYQEAISVGEKLLKEDKVKNYLTLESKIMLLHNTVIACFERGTIDKEQITKAKSIINQYKPEKLPYEFKIGPEFEILLLNGDPEDALCAVIEAVKEKKILSNQEYAQLHFQLLRIDNLIEIGQNSLNHVEKNCFIKLSNNDQWYYLGEGNALDAIPIEKQNSKFDFLFQKQLNSRIILPDEYGPEIDFGVIEFIFPIEKYIYWKSIKYFQELAKKGDLEGVHRIQIPHQDDSIDPENLIKFLQDQQKMTRPFFDLYCENKAPLAMLVKSEGGLINAIGRITQEDQGFINFSDGTSVDLNRQKKLAKSVLEEKLPFVIDSTSALFLVESGFLQKIYRYLPKIIVPRSVLNFLAKVTDRFKYIPGQKGHMGFAKGKIVISDITKDRREQLQEDFIACIKLLESTPENIRVISKAYKAEGFTEREIPEELCDACIIAKMESLPILTEDPIFIKFNEFETKQSAPLSFSIWSLARVLFEMQLLSFDDYLEFFYYLSFYRFRFLSISVDDIHKAIFGDKAIPIIQPERIRYFNLHLTFSEKYGVKSQLVYSIIAQFLVSILVDISVTKEAVNSIFLEIINELPVSVSKRKLGFNLLNICYSAISSIHEKVFPLINKEEIYNRIDYLYKSIVFLYTDN